MGEQITQGLVVCDVKKQKKHHRHRVIHNQKNNTLGRVHMKKFTKLALAASVALSANAMAMQAMDDSTLSATTGQDGISIGIGISRVTIDKVFVHDNDGLPSTKVLNGVKHNATTGVASFENGELVKENIALGGTGNAGAISIKGGADEVIQLTKAGETINRKDQAIFVGANYNSLLTSGNLADLQIDSDAGLGGGNTAFLNIAAEVSGLEIHIGEIGVTASNDVPATGATSIRRGGDDDNYNAILSGLSLVTGKMDANIQVGAAPQGAMILLETTMDGGLEIKNLGILDNSTKDKTVALNPANGNPITTSKAGEIYLESIKVANANSTDLVISSEVSVYGASAANANGFIKITNKDTGGIDTYIKGIHLGSYKRDNELASGELRKTSIGDVELQGVKTFYGADYKAGSVLTISGH